MAAEDAVSDAELLHVSLDPERCRGCQLCVGLCPNDLLVPGQTLNQRHETPVQMRYPQYCINCMRCVEICPDQAFDLPENPSYNWPGRVFGLSLRWHRRQQHGLQP